MTTKEETPESRQLLYGAAAKAWQMVAEDRHRADRLVAEDGDPVARRKAKSTRISATSFERSINRIVGWCDADFAHGLALDEPVAS